MCWLATRTTMCASHRSSGRDALLAACLAVAFALGIVALGTTGALATHQEDRTTDGFKAYTPGGEIPNPGENYSVELYMTPAHMDEEGPIPPNVEVRVEYVMYYSTTISRCDVQDTYVLGIDEGNDAPGTKTDKDMLENLKKNGNYVTGPDEDPAKMTTADWDHRQVTWLQFPDEEDFIEPLIIHGEGNEDELIVASEGCVQMPDPGWHRTFGYMNGTVTNITGDQNSVEIDGERYEEGDHFEIWESSLWYPVCDCNESRHVSMRLDPPPGKMTPGSEGGVYHPNGTVEAPYAEINESGYIIYDDFVVPPENVTSSGIVYHDGFLEFTGPIYYAEGHIEADGTIVTPSGDRIEPKGDRSPPREPTPTESGGGETPTATQTATSTDAPTPTAAADTTKTPDSGGAGTERPADTATPADRAGGQNVVTPTVGDAPGLGSLVAMLGLLVGAEAVRRKG
jgi:hypothetical protein